MRDRQHASQPEPSRFESAPFTDERPRVAPITRRTVTLGASLLATAVLAAVALVVPTPYAMRSPGPTEDTLERNLIQIEGARTYESTGQLRLTTVSVLGGPGYPMLSGQVIQGWLDPQRSVLPVEAIFPEATTKEQQQEVSQAEMVSSQESATAAALTELGYDVPAVLDVAGTEPGSGAEGKLEEGDVIDSFQGEPVGTYADLIDGLADTNPGDSVTLGVQRGQRSMDVEVTTSDNGERAVLGVFIDPHYDFPVDVSIEIENIGGPSAGTMFALGIIDKLTPEDEANGEIIAGTGTMSPEGTVGPIGGIEQKLYGAVRDDAEWFLAPAGNCDQVVGNVPDGLNVVKVATLGEARDAVEQIGRGEGGELPTCP
ncbi:YlbL family protein [Promicromonospora panici]|uniref:YlbL family protein n=1 Tax=Promicromonospora panici TaxID=2219658 RepID=UPI00101D3AD4|nr:PDZ domain-containing protein [Promicromonospora panici]